MTLYRDLVTKQCDRVGLPYTDSSVVSVLLKQLQTREKEKHKTRGILGRVPDVWLNILRKECKKRGLSTRGTPDELYANLQLNKKDAENKNANSKEKEKKKYTIKISTNSVPKAAVIAALSALGNVGVFADGKLQKKLHMSKAGNEYWKTV